MQRPRGQNDALTIYGFEITFLYLLQNYLYYFPSSKYRMYTLPKKINIQCLIKQKSTLQKKTNFRSRTITIHYVTATTKMAQISFDKLLTAGQN